MPPQKNIKIMQNNRVSWSIIQCGVAFVLFQFAFFFLVALFASGNRSSYSELNAMQNDALDGWVEKYKHYSGYPVVGKVRWPLTWSGNPKYALL